MDDKAVRTLEYNKIIESLTERAVSAAGKSAAAELLPADDIFFIRRAQKETAEAASLIVKKGSLPLGGIRDIRGPLARSVIGGTLSIDELLDVSDFIYVCGKVNTYSPSDEEYPLLTPYFEAVLKAEEVEIEINRCIKNRTEVADGASRKLSEIRVKIRQANDRVRDHLNNVIHSQTYKTMLQEALITIRNERFCVPVRAECRHSFPGMVHDQSSTGATLYIEPLSVVQLNNSIRELLFEEKKEVERILQILTGLVASHEDILRANSETLAFLDFTFAKGELALSMRATEPVFNSGGYINIKKGRHPLLPNDTVVPVDITLGGGFTMLLITGPNTGGKTVALKTAGLFTLMGQAGLHIPAFDNSELSVFDNVFADIGDEQSIEQSLSTFSSHMRNIVRILGAVTPRSLVLLDELGAGTDPTEGAALAVAILRHLHENAVRTIITTHYSELKIFAIATPGAENASCEFDVESLKPTYKLLIGIPGKSNAFAISARLGLAEEVINEARDVLSREDIRFEDLITDLEINKKTAHAEKERAEQFRREAEVLRKETENLKDRLNTQKEKILREAREAAFDSVRKAQSEADAAVKEFRRRTNENTDPRNFDDARRIMRESLSGMEKMFAPDSSTAHTREIKPFTEQIRAGDRVFVLSLNQSAVIVTPPDEDGETEISLGSIKMKVGIKDLCPDQAEQKKRSILYDAPNSVKSGKSMNIKNEIDLRGQLAAESIEITDKYLDDACLSGLKQVTIIHGKGTGALRNAVQTHLKNHPHVKSYRLGTFGEGENGVTIVELQND
ncbi:MAG: endonuclease MutS2 [Defluviitaleaceae bacterium]|nr:endonuclease MutS2 [Defluviitaleaceae bacterium]